MIKQLKYDFYRLTMPSDANLEFGEILGRIHVLRGRNRLYTTGEDPVRLHSFNRGPADILGDIARIRMNDIPNKMKLSGETAPIDLDDDEGLGETASFIYHPATRVLMMMRNRNAVSISGFIRYIEGILQIQGIQFSHVLQIEAYQRLQRLVRIQKFELEIAAPGNGRVFTELGLAPEGALDLMGASPRVRMSLVFSTGYERELSLPRRTVEGFVNIFRRRRPDDEESISLVVSGKEDNSPHKEVIDLFEDVLVDCIDVNIRNQRRITDDHKHAATRSVWSRHRDSFIQMFAENVTQS